MTDHIVAGYDRDLADLETSVSRMAGMAEAMLSSAAQALARGDHGLAERVILSDDVVDRLDRSIEQDAIALIARRQPLAGDLRRIIATLKISAELERVGDLARGIAQRGQDIDSTQLAGVLTGVLHLAQLAARRLKAVVDAYMARDDSRAVSVWLRDKEIDALYGGLFRELVTYMMEDPRMIGGGTQLLFCAKSIERVGDHATNIAEIVHYVVTGDLLTVERPKGGETAYEPLPLQLRPH
jgi:phosphate transport system protein